MAVVATLSKGYDLNYIWKQVDLGPARGGERVEPDEQFAVAGDDVTGGDEGFADEGVGLVASAGVVPVQRAGEGSFRVLGGHPDRVGDLLHLGF